MTFNLCGIILSVPVSSKISKPTDLKSSNKLRLTHSVFPSCCVKRNCMTFKFLSNTKENYKYAKRIVSRRDNNYFMHGLKIHSRNRKHQSTLTVSKSRYTYTYSLTVSRLVFELPPPPPIPAFSLNTPSVL